MSNNQVIELRQLGTDTIQYTDSLGKIKNNATSRVTLLDGKSDKIIKMANTLETLSKRRR